MAGYFVKSSRAERILRGPRQSAGMTGGARPRRLPLLSDSFHPLPILTRATAEPRTPTLHARALLEPWTWRAPKGPLSARPPKPPARCRAAAFTAHRYCVPPTLPQSLLGRRTALPLRHAPPPRDPSELLAARAAHPSCRPQPRGNARARASGPAPRTPRPARARRAPACGKSSSLTWTGRGSLPPRSPCRSPLHYREVGGLAAGVRRAERGRGSRAARDRPP